jgi:dolichol-phosphate mannosyltransferase
MIHIVLPAYNEEKDLPPLLAEIGWHMEEAGLPFTVLIVNDGSTDGTAAVIDEAAKSIPVVRVDHPRNRGLAEAIKTGLWEAARRAGDRDIIVTMDSDNTHAPGLIVRMARMIGEGHDVVIGSRYQRGARTIGVPLHRRFLSYGASLMFRALFPIRGVKDYSSGYRAYRARVIREMFEAYGAEFVDRPGFSCMVDLLLKIRAYPYVIGEAPLILRYDKKASASKMKVAATVLETFELAAIRLFRR